MFTKLLPKDFERARPIVIVYPSGGGGKTVINSLALSSHAVMQDSKLIQRQIDQGLTPKEKFNVIMERLAALKGPWNDLGMGELTFLSPQFNMNLTYSQKLDYMNMDFYSSLKEAIDKDLRFFLTVHSIDELRVVTEVWPNYELLVMDNLHDFIFKVRKNYRYKQIENFYNDIKGPTWPDQAPNSLEEYYKLPQFVIEELENLFEDQIYKKLVLFDKEKATKEISQLIGHSNWQSWNSEWLLNSDQFVDNIGKLCQHWNLGNTDLELVRQYFDLWLENTLKGG